MNSKYGLNVFVEGNIGAGKSTLLFNLLSMNSKIQVFTEPLERWQNCNGVNLFSMYYSNPHKYAFVFQSYVMLTMLQRQKLPYEKPIRLYERSMISENVCFLEALYQTEKIDATMLSILQQWHSFFETQFCPKIDLIIYIKTSPTAVYQRIQQRGRSEERHVLFAFINLIHSLYEKWLNEQTRYKVIIIDGDSVGAKITDEYEKCLKTMEIMLLEKNQLETITENVTKMFGDYDTDSN